MDNDLISRSELKKALCEFMKNNIGIYSNEIFYIVDSIPAVDAPTCTDIIEANKEGYNNARRLYERPQGEWIDTGSGQECSICKEIQYGYDSFRNFCPNCGADMRKPNCVTCDHFGKCEGCEKGEEE